MTPYVGDTEVSLSYIFDEDYVDFCHPNNPECVSGVTCPNCDDGFNPHLIVESYLISMGSEPLDETGIALGLDDIEAAGRHHERLPGSAGRRRHPFLFQRRRQRIRHRCLSAGKL